jgi:malonate decarboxylase beta subunit
MSSSFSACSAAQRARALLDPEGVRLQPIGEGAQPVAVVADGRLDGRPTTLLCTDGRAHGGTLGIAEARALSTCIADAERRGTAIVACWDTGGVRVQEGPAALAAASAVGVALARLGLLGTPVVHVVSGPRGCFGAPSVVAASGHATLLVGDALWGLTGPRLLEGARDDVAGAQRLMAAGHRVAAGHATAAVADDASAVRAALAAELSRAPARRDVGGVCDAGRAVTTALRAQLEGAPAPVDEPRRARRRDFFAYSFRRQWRPDGPSFRGGHVHAARGLLGSRPVMAVIVGPEQSQRGIGVEDADVILAAIGHAVRHDPGAPIVTFLFCRGHASDVREERAGISRALAECLKGLVAARLAGHPLVCVLGGGAYGAAYLTLAAPSHRVLALRGTTVAPMAPRVLGAFQRMRGMRDDAGAPALAHLVPDIRMVEGVVRLHTELGDEIAGARADAARAPAHAIFAVGR